MRITINLRDANSTDWSRFWFAQVDEDGSIPLKRFGFRICLLDLDADYGRLATECATRMKWVRATLRAEDLATMRRGYQAVRDCKSHRAIGNSARTLARTDKMIGEITSYVRELMN